MAISVPGRAFTCAGRCFHSHVEFCVRHLFFLLKKKYTTPFVSLALLYSLVVHHVVFLLIGTQHTPCIIADRKITCQNTSILTPSQI